jgi:polygalacturonase
LIDNCFIRTKDDCIAIKAGVNYFTDFESGGNVKNVTVQNSVFWNGTWGNGLEIGFETRAGTMENIVFRNLDMWNGAAPSLFTTATGPW